MTGKTRYFLIGSALVFFVGLSIGLVAYYGGMPQGLFASNTGPAELALVPEDAAVVAYANVQQVMSSDLRQRLRQFGGPSDKGRDEIRTATGIDIEKDVDHVVAFINKRQDDAAPNATDGLVLARGRFDQGRLEAFAREKGATTEDYKGKRLIRPQAKAETEETGHGREADLEVAFLESGLVAIGPSAVIRRVIDGQGGRSRSARDNADLMKLIADQRESSFWVVGQFAAITSQAKLPQEVTDRIPPITWFSAGGHVNGGVQVMMKAETNSDEAANNLRDIVRGFVALAKLQAGNRPEAQALWPSVEMGGTGKTVSLSFGVTTQLIDTMTPKKRSPGGKPKPEAPKSPEAPEKPVK